MVLKAPKKASVTRRRKFNCYCLSEKSVFNWLGFRKAMWWHESQRSPASTWIGRACWRKLNAVTVCQGVKPSLFPSQILPITFLLSLKLNYFMLWFKDLHGHLFIWNHIPIHILLGSFLFWIGKEIRSKSFTWQQEKVSLFPKDSRSSTSAPLGLASPSATVLSTWQRGTKCVDCSGLSLGFMFDLNVFSFLHLLQSKYCTDEGLMQRLREEGQHLVLFHI